MDRESIIGSGSEVLGSVLNPNFETDTQVTNRGEIAPMDTGRGGFETFEYVYE